MAWEGDGGLTCSFSTWNTFKHVKNTSSYLLVLSDEVWCWGHGQVRKGPVKDDACGEENIQYTIMQTQITWINMCFSIVPCWVCWQLWCYFSGYAGPLSGTPGSYHWNDKLTDQPCVFYPWGDCNVVLSTCIKGQTHSLKYYAVTVILYKP